MKPQTNWNEHNTVDGTQNQHKTQTQKKKPLLDTENRRKT